MGLSLAVRDALVVYGILAASLIGVLMAVYPVACYCI